MVVEPKSVKLREIFEGCVGAGATLSDPSDLKFYATDASKEFEGIAGLVLMPVSTKEVQAIVKTARKKRIALVPSGGRTGYSGGSVALNGEVVVSLARMNKILNLDVVGQTVRCQAGVITEKIQKTAAENGLFYPVDFASRGSSQIGGNIATNAGGVRVLRYGMTRDWVLGLKVVTGEGEVLDLNGALVKNQTGYDLRHLFIGSEGTLGIITEVTLQLTSPLGPSRVVLCAVGGAKEALSVLSRLRKAGFVATLFEYFERSGLERVLDHFKSSDPFKSRHDAYVLIEIESLAEEEDSFDSFLAQMVEEGAVLDGLIAHSTKQAARFREYRELISEALRATSVPHKNDVSVAVADIPEFIVELKGLVSSHYREFEVVIFGHLGDGNLHINVVKPKEMDLPHFLARCKEMDLRLFELVRRFSGSISAEHGVGLLKREFLNFSRSQEEIRLMRQIKAVFDPDGIMNPGKVL